MPGVVVSGGKGTGAAPGVGGQIRAALCVACTGPCCSTAVHHRVLPPYESNSLLSLQAYGGGGRREGGEMEERRRPDQPPGFLPACWQHQQLPMRRQVAGEKTNA